MELWEERKSAGRHGTEVGGREGEAAIGKGHERCEGGITRCGIGQKWVREGGAGDRQNHR